MFFFSQKTNVCFELQIMPLENEMKTPRSFGSTCGVINTGMTLIIFLYVAMGFFGYMCYGDKIDASITLNLPPSDILSKVIQILLALAIFVTHALQCYVAIDIVWNDYVGSYFEKNSRSLVYEYIVRTILVFITCE